MRQLNRAELGTYTQFIRSRGYEPSNVGVDEAIELSEDMQKWLRGHFVDVYRLKLAIGLLATKNGGVR